MRRHVEMCGVLALHFLIILLCGSLSLAQPQGCGNDIMFIVDASSSVTSGFEEDLKFVASLADFLVIGEHGHRVALLEFSGLHQIVKVYDFDHFNSTEDFKSTVLALPQLRGTTFTERALEVALKVLEKRKTDTETIVMVVTDGFAFDRPEVPAEKMRALPNVVTYAAGTHTPFDLHALELLAGDPGRVFVQPDAELKARNLFGPVLQCQVSPIPVKKPEVPPSRIGLVEASNPVSATPPPSPLPFPTEPTQILGVPFSPQSPFPSVPQKVPGGPAGSPLQPSQPSQLPRVPSPVSPQLPGAPLGTASVPSQVPGGPSISALQPSQAPGAPLSPAQPVVPQQPAGVPSAPLQPSLVPSGLQPPVSQPGLPSQPQNAYFTGGSPGLPPTGPLLPAPSPPTFSWVPAAVPVPAITQAPVPVPAITQAPVTVPTVTQAPVTVPTVTQAPVTVPAATQAPVTVPPATLAPVPQPPRVPSIPVPPSPAAARVPETYAPQLPRAPLPPIVAAIPQPASPPTPIPAQPVPAAPHAPVLPSLPSSPKNCPIDLLILLDTSGSTASRFDTARKLAVQLGNSLKIGPSEARVGLISYAGPSSSKPVFPLDKPFGSASVIEEIQNQQASPAAADSCTDEALAIAAQEFAKPAPPRVSTANQVVVLFSNGHVCQDPSAQAALLRNRGVKIYSVVTIDDDGTPPVFGDDLVKIVGDPNRIFTHCWFEDFLTLLTTETCS